MKTSKRNANGRWQMAKSGEKGKSRVLNICSEYPRMNIKSKAGERTSALILAFHFSHSRVHVISLLLRKSFLIEHSAVIGHIFYYKNKQTDCGLCKQESL